MKLYEGRILTVDAKDSIAAYLVEDNGRILYVGNNLPKEYDRVKRVELGDKVMVPAFMKRSKSKTLIDFGASPYSVKEQNI